MKEGRRRSSGERRAPRMKEVVGLRERCQTTGRRIRSSITGKDDSIADVLPGREGKLVKYSRVCL